MCASVHSVGTHPYQSPNHFNFWQLWKIRIGLEWEQSLIIVRVDIHHIEIIFTYILFYEWSDFWAKIFSKLSKAFLLYYFCSVIRFQERYSSLKIVLPSPFLSLCVSKYSENIHSIRITLNKWQRERRTALIFVYLT